jgi:flagellar biosynthesis chaperone FliJ
MDETALTVDTPWGKLITLKGLEILLTGFNNDLETINQSLTNIEARLNEIESTGSVSNANSRVQAIEGSLKSLEEEIFQFRKNQSKFAQHMKQTLQLFHARLDEITIKEEDH